MVFRQSKRNLSCVLSKFIAFSSWWSEGCSKPQSRSRAEPWWGSKGRGPRKILKFCNLRYLDKAKKSPPFTPVWIQSQKKNSSSSGTYEKRKICSTRFHNFMQVSWSCNWICRFCCVHRDPKKIDQRFISRTSKFRNIITIFTKLTKRVNNRKPKRLLIILVTYSLLTIFVSYEENSFLCFPCYCASDC